MSLSDSSLLVNQSLAVVAAVAVGRMQGPGFGTVGAERGILRFCLSKKGLAARDSAQQQDSVPTN